MLGTTRENARAENTLVVVFDLERILALTLRRIDRSVHFEMGYGNARLVHGLHVLEVIPLRHSVDDPEICILSTHIG